MTYSEEELERLQSIETEMLRSFVDICNRLNLRYYVLGGTLLGAVRHNGFIPWDDDIDVGMPRKDYEVFISKAPEMLPAHIFLQNYRTEKDCCINITKLRDVNTTLIERACRKQNICHGVFLDVFPLDNFPDSLALKVWYIVYQKVLNARICTAFCYDNKKNPVKEFLRLPLKLIWTDVKSAVAAKERLHSSFPRSGMIANYCGMWGKKEIVPEDWYGEGCELNFEGIRVKVPKEYDKWLTQVYGDYMQLPPLEKRVSHHSMFIVDLDKPYTEYCE